MTGLTLRQAAILDAIVEYFNEHGIYPSMRNLGNLTGVGSMNGVNDHLRCLIREGYIAPREGATSRSLVVLRTSDGTAVRARLVSEFGEASTPGAEQTATVEVPIFRSLSGMRAGGVR